MAHSKELILWGTVSQDGYRWSVNFSSPHAFASTLSGYDISTFQHAFDSNPLHPEAVVIDYRTAKHAPVVEFVLGPMPATGPDAPARGEVFSWEKRRLVPRNGHDLISMDYVNWQDYAESATGTGATVTPFTDFIERD